MFPQEREKWEKMAIDDKKRYSIEKDRYLQRKKRHTSMKVVHKPEFRNYQEDEISTQKGNRKWTQKRIEAPCLTHQFRLTVTMGGKYEPMDVDLKLVWRR